MRSTPSFLFLAILFFFSILSLSIAAPSPPPPASSEKPYQFFHSDFSGGNNAVCWLAQHSFPDNVGIECHLATTISQLSDRQIWTCTGDQAQFCKGCDMLKEKLTSSIARAHWRSQGC